MKGQPLSAVIWCKYLYNSSHPHSLILISRHGLPDHHKHRMLTGQCKTCGRHNREVWLWHQGEFCHICLLYYICLPYCVHFLSYYAQVCHGCTKMGTVVISMMAGCEYSLCTSKKDKSCLWDDIQVHRKQRPKCWSASAPHHSNLAICFESHGIMMAAGISHSRGAVLDCTYHSDLNIYDGYQAAASATTWWVAGPFTTITVHSRQAKSCMSTSIVGGWLHCISGMEWHSQRRETFRQSPWVAVCQRGGVGWRRVFLDLDICQYQWGKVGCTSTKRAPLKMLCNSWLSVICTISETHPMQSHLIFILNSAGLTQPST